ncbi:alpha/beta fold hydrolase [Deinococcus yavapaiensis]|uniref:Pimeloyl-ACP methyl ester carboxylesterase n=1 Tax=Deinococcus yavapaiensis KR-236 TaxID=694435 RepID=A0A318S9M7_9DEIO|nr:alpha/beta hydrolase [Deinococcus yavapaiensis]PYE55435.1 pimeloyl-ACP methyl ester carboxylesterase [Deinococcus yavapaiensis KR-236]
MTDIRVKSGEAELIGEVSGEGRTVVFLHAGVADRRMWRAQVAATEARTVTYDRRGFGDTRPQDEPYAHIDDLLAVLNHVGAERATLVGCSQGGKIALDFALAHSERVEGLVLIAPSIGGAPAPETFPPAVEALLEDLEVAEESGDVDRLNEMEARVWLDGVLGEEGRVSGELRALFLDMNGVALRASQLGEERPADPAWPRLADITAPTLIVVGDLDFPHAQERCSRLASLVRDARLVVMPRAAHLPSFEHPEAFQGHLDAFLASSSR